MARYFFLAVLPGLIAASPLCPGFSIASGKITASNTTTASITTAYDTVTVICNLTCSGLHFGTVTITSPPSCRTTLFGKLTDCTPAHAKHLPACHSALQPFSVSLIIVVCLSLILITAALFTLRRFPLWCCGVFHRDRSHHSAPLRIFPLQRHSSRRRYPNARPPQPPPPVPALTTGSTAQACPTVYTLTFIFCLIPLSTACDYTHYQTGAASSCADTTKPCTSSQSVLIKMTVGQTSCFRSLQNTTTNITLHSAELVLSATFQYNTSLYDVNTEFDRRCLSAGECTTDNCLKRKAAIFPNHWRWSLVRYECRLSRSISDWCWWGVTCGSAKLEVTPRFYRFPVYQITRSRYIYNVTYSTQDGGRSTVLVSHDTDDTPAHMVVMSSEGPTISYLPYLIVFNGTAYNVNACPLGANRLSSLGEIQIVGAHFTFPIDEIAWAPSLYSHGFSLPNQYMEVNFLNPSVRAGLLSFPRIARGALGQRLAASMQVARSISFMITSPTFLEELYVVPHCSFAVIGAVSCTSCGLSPQFHIESHNVQRAGLVSFISTCQFDRSVLHCNSTTYLTCSGVCNNPCSLTFPGSKIPSLQIEFQSQDLGDLPSLRHADHTYAVSDSFAWLPTTTIQWVTTTLASGIGIFTLLKVFMYCYALRSARSWLPTLTPAPAST